MLRSRNLRNFKISEISGIYFLLFYFFYFFTFIYFYFACFLESSRNDTFLNLSSISQNFGNEALASKQACSFEHFATITFRDLFESVLFYRTNMLVRQYSFNTVVSEFLTHTNPLMATYSILGKF